MSTALEAVAARLTGVARTYPLNEVPSAPDYPYSTYYASLGRADGYLLDDTEVVRWGRVVVQSFAKTAEAALDQAEDIRTALRGARLQITGYATTPTRCELDPATDRDPDDHGVVGVTTTYTFTATVVNEEN